MTSVSAKSWIKTARDSNILDLKNYVSFGLKKLQSELKSTLGEEAKQNKEIAKLLKIDLGAVETARCFFTLGLIYNEVFKEVCSLSNKFNNELSFFKQMTADRLISLKSDILKELEAQMDETGRALESFNLDKEQLIALQKEIID